MTTVDIEALVAALDPTKHGGRRHIDDVAVALREITPNLDSAAFPDLLLETIQHGETAGYWSPARTTTVRRGRITLPKSITLTRKDVTTDQRRPVDVPLRPELAPWAATLPLLAAQRRVLLAVNAWLRQTGGNTPIVAAAERAYQLLNDEKAFDTVPPLGGKSLWRDDRLTFQLLRCERTPTPLTWEPTTQVVTEAGAIVCVENHATFRTLLRILRSHPTPPWTAVAWIQGRNTAPLESLVDMPFIVERLDYIGDLDPAGLEIAEAACMTSERVGVPAGPATDLWDLLIKQASRPGRAVNETRARQLVSWLPEQTRDRAAALLIDGRRIPQEALRYDILELALPRPGQLDISK
ncbi:hypothetical protein ACIBCN_39685 [Nocardia sp. NPDC051052]|uniref:hypothetical protein n=1 Tax=Nocardia sp. NPDC051052 TaxID=3364322 RepID=UPI0037A30C60